MKDIDRLTGQRAAWAVLVMVAVVSNSACGDRAALERSTGLLLERRDSASVRITVSSARALETALPWTIDSVPDLQIGQLEGEEVYQFHRINGVAGFPDGGFVVVDGSSQELRWFDSGGVYRFAVGREGEGPAEFRNPILVPVFQSDSLLIFDTMARRFTWVASDGSGHRSQPFTGDRRLIAGAASAARGSQVLFRTAAAPCLMEEYCEGTLYVRWVDLVDLEADTLIEFVRRSARTISPTGVAFLTDGPFDAIGLARVGPRGPVVGGGPQYELREYSSTGTLVNVLRIDAAPAAVTEQALEEVVTWYSRGTSDTDQARGIFARMEMPQFMPAFQSLIVDAIGWYWVELFRIDQTQPARWLVLDPEGVARGLVELPEELQVYDIGERYVFGKSYDDMRVEYVRRYPLTRDTR